jgi:hypothetical protein
MNVNWPIRCFVGYVGAIAIAALIGGCEVRAPGPPALVIGPPGPVVVGPPSIEIVDEHGYHHHGYYDDHHAWHGWYVDAHNVRHDDAPDWRHR